MKTTQEAAEYLGVSPRRVVALIKSGYLEAEKVGKIWLIDDASLEFRSKNAQRPGGRPSRGSGPTETKYVLKNRTHEIAGLVYDSVLKEFTSVGALLDSDRAPLGLANERGSISAASFNSWWRNRGIPDGRPALISMLAEEGTFLPFELAVKSLGLSLSDQYWICPEESELRWEEVNYFTNSFGKTQVNNEDVSSLRNPDNTSDGILPKHWILRNGERRLLKGGGELSQEPYNEVVATALHRRVLGCNDYVPYELDRIEDVVVSSCPEFLSDKEEFVSAFYVMRTLPQQAHNSEYRHYLECCFALGADDTELALSHMIVCDDLLANSDRHFRNFGIIRNVETLECRPAPLFDSGTSIWCTKPFESLKRGDFDFKSKPFKSNPGMQLSLVSDFSWLDISTLEGFVEEAITILAENEYLSERLPYIEKGLQRRVERMTSIRKFL